MTPHTRPLARLAVALGLAAASIALPSSNGAHAGTIDPLISWPLIPIHAALMPNGRVMSFGTDQVGKQGGLWVYDVWNPALGTGTTSHTVLANNTQGDIFCSVAALGSSGRLNIFGGDVNVNGNTTNVGITGAFRFSGSTNTLSRLADMAFPRWYASVVVMPNGESVVLGGSSPFIDVPEVYNESTGWRTLTGARSSTIFGKRASYPHAWVGPNGLIFGVAGNEMFEVNPAGTGTIRSLGFMNDSHWGNSSSVMYAPGRVMIVGGSDAAAVTLININGPTPVVTVGARLNRGRNNFHQATVLPDGKVLVSGGSTTGIFDASGAVLPTEVWNPATGLWTADVSVAVPRLYHSGALLMPDGTVLIAGGGAPGPFTNLNAETYRPSYLQAGARPTYTTSTTRLRYGRSFSMSVNSGTVASKVSLVRLGSMTHGINLEQRYAQLTFTQSGTSITATNSYNQNSLPPGYYLLTVVNQSGVPSLSRIVRVTV